MFRTQPRTSKLDDSLLEVVTDLVPPGSATLEREWVKQAGGWVVSVTPESPDACPFSLGAHGRDAVRFTIGQGTAFEVYGVRKARHLGLVKQLVSGIVAGRVREFGSGKSGYASIGLARGEFKTSRRGLFRFFPLPLVGRTYAPYAAPEA